MYKIVLNAISRNTPVSTSDLFSMPISALNLHIVEFGEQMKAKTNVRLTLIVNKFSFICV